MKEHKTNSAEPEAGRETFSAPLRSQIDLCGISAYENRIRLPHCMSWVRARKPVYSYRHQQTKTIAQDVGLLFNKMIMNDHK
jgi:hypothetical protein